MEYEGPAASSSSAPADQLVLFADLQGRAEIVAARPQLSNAYTKQRAAANAEANAEKFFTQVETGAVVRHDALHIASDITKVQKHKQMTKVEFLAQKDDLERTLFEMFRVKEHWPQKDVAVRASSLQQVPWP